MYSHCWEESIQELGQQSKREGGQQEVERGEGQASRMRHALPQAVIHLHTDYATRVNHVLSAVGGRQGAKALLHWV